MTQLISQTIHRTELDQNIIAEMFAVFNESFEQVLARHVARRNFLKGAAVSTGLLVINPSALAGGALAQRGDGGRSATLTHPAGEFPSGQRGRAVNPLAQPS